MADEEVVQTEEPTEEDKEAVSSAKKKLLIFWLRMLGWVGTGVVAPITTFAIKFGLFDKSGYEITTDELGNVTGTYIALNGWGIVSVCLIAFAVYEIINEVIKSRGPGYSYTKQILTGVLHRIIPMAIAIGVCFWLKGVLENVIFCLTVIGISQIGAITLNPLPKWRSEKLKEEDYSDVLTGLVKLVKERVKKEDK